MDTWHGEPRGYIWSPQKGGSPLAIPLLHKHSGPLPPRSFVCQGEIAELEASIPGDVFGKAAALHDLTVATDRVGAAIAEVQGRLAETVEAPSGPSPGEGMGLYVCGFGVICVW